MARTLGIGKLPSGEQVHLQSSVVGPAMNPAAIGEARLLPHRFHWSTHVEGHAAAIMRQQNLDYFELTINHPMGVCRACHFQAPAMMPEGAVLRVLSPGPDKTTRSQWVNRAGIHDHDPRVPPPVGRPTGGRIHVGAGACFADMDHWFDSWPQAWALIEQVARSNPFFFEISHEHGAFEPFSLVGQQHGVAVLQFLQSDEPFLMRAFGMHVPPAAIGPDTMHWSVLEWDDVDEQSGPVGFWIPTTHFLLLEHAEGMARWLIERTDKPASFNDFYVFAP